MADDRYGPDYEQVLHAYEALLEGDVGACFEKLAEFLGQKDLLSEDDRLSRAEQLVRDGYYTSVIVRIADDFAKEWRSGAFRGSREAAVESLEQSCDNACTYNHDAHMIIAHSDHRDEYVREHGEAPHSGDDIHWSAVATMALRADVIDHLRDVDDVDINDVPPIEPIVDCDICGEWKPGEGDVCNDCREGADDEDDQVRR